MKIQLDCGNNSSAVAFVAYSIHSKELTDYIRSLIDQGRQIYGDLKKGLFPREEMGELQVLGEDEVAMVRKAADMGLFLDNCVGYDSRNLSQKAADNRRFHNASYIANFLCKFFSDEKKPVRSDQKTGRNGVFQRQDKLLDIPGGNRQLYSAKRWEKARVLDREKDSCLP